MTKRLYLLLTLLLATTVVLSACQPADETVVSDEPAVEEPAAEEPAAEEPAAEEPAAEEPMAGECTDTLGCVEIAAGDPVRIAALFVMSGANEALGRDSLDGAEIAVEDFGPIMGHDIALQSEDSECSPEGGQTAATKVAADQSILGIVGTSCSSAAKAAIPIVTDAGTVIISPSNTGPDLTAADRPPEYAGYLRTAHNDLFQGRVAAQFAIDELGITKAATIHDGSTYAEQLQDVFAETFTELGGEITDQQAVNEGDVDMRPVLTSISATEPDLIYYPVFTDEGGFITAQAREVAGLEDTILMGADGMFSEDFVKAAGPAVDGMYLSGPYVAGERYDAFVARVEEKYGRGTLSGFHAHAYDATMILLNAIAAAAVEGDDGSLTIGRQALRDAVFATDGYEGLTGTLTCQSEGFPGDCATGEALAVFQLTADQVDGIWPPEAIYRP